jgi:hypothetical protein
MRDITHDNETVEKLKKMNLIDIQLASIKIEDFKLKNQFQWVNEWVEGLGEAQTVLLEHENRYYAIQIFEMNQESAEVTLFVEKNPDTIYPNFSDDIPPKAKVLRFLEELGARHFIWFNEYEFLMPEEKLETDIQFYSKKLHDEDLIKYIANRHQISEEIVSRKINKT